MGWKERLEQYRSLRAELDHLETEIAQMEKMKDKEMEVVKSSQREFPYNPSSYTFPSITAKHQKLLDIYKNRYISSLDEKILLEEFISTISDGETRLIIELYYMKGLRWKDVEKAINERNEVRGVIATGDRERKIMERFLKRLV